MSSPLAALLRMNAQRHEAGRFTELLTPDEWEPADSGEDRPRDLSTAIAFALLAQWDWAGRASFPRSGCISRGEWPEVGCAVAEDLDAERPVSDPRAIHTWAFCYNWDDGFELMWQIVDDPKTERGTALLICWRLGGPRAFAEEPDPLFREPARLYRAAEQRFLSGFYQGNSIRYDPVEDNQLTKTQLYLLKKQGVPQVLLQPS